MREFTINFAEPQPMSNSDGYDARAVANAILDVCDQQSFYLSNMALQKVVYFCHMHSIVERDLPLVKHEFEAWEHGPVVGYLYREFKSFGSNRITDRALALDLSTGNKAKATAIFDDQTTALISKYASLYGRVSAFHLSDLSHTEDGPWHTVWNHRGKINPGMRISNDAIKSFYKPMHTRPDSLNASPERRTP